MKRIKDILKEKQIPKLIHICQQFGLRGYSNLRKEGIINLIAENLKNPQIQEFIKYLIPDNQTVALILKSFIDNNNEISYENLRTQVLQKRSGTTFRDNYRILLARCIIFEIENSEDDILYLPKEFINIANDIIEVRIKGEEKELEVEEFEEEFEAQKEIKSIKSIDQLLYSKKYTNVNNIQNLLLSYNLKISGTKNQLIDRLLYESNENLKDILELFFGKSELKDICRDFGLTISGNKEDLIKKIIEKLPLANKEQAIPKDEEMILESKVSTKKIKGPASGRVEEKIIESPQIFPPVEKINIKAKIYEFLKDIVIDYKTIADIKSLSGQIFSVIQNLKLFNPGFNNSVINRDQKESIITIENNGDIVAVSVWYFDKYKSPGNQKQKIALNTMTYKKNFSKDLICYIYDPAGKLPEDEIKMFKEYMMVIHKIEMEFKA